MKIFKAFAAFLIGCLCICSTLVFLIQEDSWFKDRVRSAFTQTFATNFDCKFQTNIARINLFTGTIILKNTHVASKENNDWSWQADQINVQISWLPSLIRKKIVAQIQMSELNVTSNINQGQLALIPHLRKLITPAANALPFDVSRLYIRQATTRIEHLQSSCSLMIDGQAEIKKEANGAAYHVKAMLNKGNITRKSTTLVTTISGTIEGKIALQASQESFADISCSGKLMQQPEDDSSCSLQGRWSPSHTTLHCATKSKQINGSFTCDQEKNCVAQATLPLAYLLQCAGIGSKKLEGSCSLRASSKANNPQENGSLKIVIDQLKYQEIILPCLQTDLIYCNNSLQGPIICMFKDKQIAQGTCSFDPHKQECALILTNSNAVRLPELWEVPAQKLQLSCKLKSTGEFFGEYEGLFSHTTHAEQKTVKGILHVTSDHLVAQGTGDQFTYDFLAGCKPFLHLEYADFYLRKEPVINLKAESPTAFSGTINYPLIRFLADAFGFHLPGEGTMHVKTEMHNQNITVELALENGNIRLPYTYNLLQGIQGTILCNTDTRCLTLDNFSLTLHKGSMHIAHAQACLNKQLELTYMHVPLKINNCFLGMQKDLFALFSGALTFEYIQKRSAQLTGFMTLDRSHIRNNIFSDEFRKNIFGQKMSSPLYTDTDINFNVKIMTRSPLRIKTPFLEASAHAKINLQGSRSNPAISGNIEIANGAFLFPYKPLFIKRGNIYFLPQQIDDPIVDILAENNIRKYSVRMTVDGTAQHPRISFDAMPTLQEEQIVALLLGGSEDGSLFLAMPTSVMTSIQKLLFGPAESTSQFQRTLKNLFSPLKNLRITPSFSDQTARGGLRGALVIDVNDRLRAIIEQNFSLPEDVVIQVEYDLSDDARIRAMRDERGDLGGELEARWKF